MKKVEVRFRAFPRDCTQAGGVRRGAEAKAVVGWGGGPGCCGRAGLEVGFVTWLLLWEFGLLR